MISGKVKLSGTILITGPCYICKDMYWGRGADDFLTGGVRDGMLLITPTGVGDITGGVFKNGESMVGTFGADAGVFGVFNLEKVKLEKWFDHEKFKKLPKVCYTILENFEGECRVEIEAPASDGWGEQYGRGEQYRIIGDGNFFWMTKQIGV